MIQVHQRLFNPMQSVGSFKPTATSIFELAGLPQPLFDLAYFFLVLEEETRGFAVARYLGSER